MAAFGKVNEQRDVSPTPLDARSEDFLRAAADWVWETGADLRLIAVSPPVARRLGVPAHHYLGCDLRELGEPDRAAPGDPEGLAALAERRAFRHVPLAMATPGGRRITFHLSGVPYYDAYGRFAGYRGTAVELPRAAARDEAPTDLVRNLEYAFLRYNDLEWKLSQAERSSGVSQERLASLLHELRTPLNAVVGYAELALTRAERSGLDQATRGDLQNICEASQHMARLMAELSERAPVPPGGSNPDPGPADVPDPAAAPQDPPAERIAPCTPAANTEADVDLAQVLRDAKAMTELSARRAGVRFQEVGPLKPTPVEGERKALTQIVVNLLANAVKFTPAGGDVGARLEDDGGDTVRLAIWDTGPGVPAEERERIFERNYRMPRHNGDGGPPGTGLGLAIARQLAREHGGELTAESHDGGGASFVLELKRASQTHAA